jgi:hypothetical protein
MSIIWYTAKAGIQRTVPGIHPWLCIKTKVDFFLNFIFELFTGRTGWLIFITFSPVKGSTVVSKHLVQGLVFLEKRSIITVT